MLANPRAKIPHRFVVPARAHRLEGTRHETHSNDHYITMSITGKRDEIAMLIRETKQEKVRSTHDPDRLHTNIHNVTHGWRGNDLIVAIYPSGLSIDSALNAAKATAVGFGCDALALTTETYQAGTPTSPLTGKRWVPGEMQRAADEHGALETGAVIEALVTLVVNRAGDISGVSQQYRVHRSVNALGVTSYDIEWLPEIADGYQREGRIVKSLVRFMNDPAVDVHIARIGIDPADYDSEQTRTHTSTAESSKPCTAADSKAQWRY
jgi:hypothetical protein